ncbi:hypothetical protein EXIGLDRAFT_580480, partial [Exidia glandulosa HHB12029]
VLFHNVLHVPALASNLLCVYALMTKGGFVLEGRDHTLSFRKDGRVVMTASVNERNTGYLNGKTAVSHAANAAAPAPVPLKLWHQRFCHRDPDAIRAMAKSGAVTGLRISGSGSVSGVCVHCLAGKQKRNPIPRGPRPRRDSPLRIVHFDLKGPLPRSREGYYYWALGVDDHS